MKSKLSAPFAILCILLLAGCSSGPSADCVSADKYIKEQKDELKQIPFRIKAVEDDKGAMLLALYEYCKTNPTKFLNNPDNYNSLTKKPASDCSDWHTWSVFDKQYDRGSDIAALEDERARIKTRLTTELQINAECFDEKGFLK